MADENVGTDRPVKQVEKQVENPMNLNPTGKGGFADHPELINKNGRPPKDWAWAELLEDIGEEVEEKTGKTFKQLVGRRLWLECVNGNVLAIKELFNRMEGLPRMKLEVNGKIDMKIPELIDRIDKMLNISDEPTKDSSH